MSKYLVLVCLENTVEYWAHLDHYWVHKSLSLENWDQILLEELNYLDNLEEINLTIIEDSISSKRQAQIELELIPFEGLTVLFKSFDTTLLPKTQEAWVAYLTQLENDLQTKEKGITINTAEKKEEHSCPSFHFLFHETHSSFSNKPQLNHVFGDAPPFHHVSQDWVHQVEDE